MISSTWVYHTPVTYDPVKWNIWVALWQLVCDFSSRPAAQFFSDTAQEPEDLPPTGAQLRRAHEKTVRNGWDYYEGLPLPM